MRASINPTQRTTAKAFSWVRKSIKESVAIFFDAKKTAAKETVALEKFGEAAFACGAGLELVILRRRRTDLRIGGNIFKCLLDTAGPNNINSVNGFS